MNAAAGLRTPVPPRHSALRDVAAAGHCCSTCPLPALCGDSPQPGLPGALLDSVLEQQHLEAGATLYMAGQKRSSIWVISTGALKSCELDLEGREQVVGFHGAGAVLGLERLEISEHRGFALALEPTSVCRIPVGKLLDRLSTAPELWREVLRIAGSQIAQAREVHRVLGQLQTGQRLAWFLLAATGPRRSECRCSGATVIQLPMARHDIASYLGMTLETVSRSFSALQRDGLIAVQGRTVRLLEPDRLAQRIVPQAATA